MSSTCVDLADHRKAVEEVLLRMEQQASVMEHFGSRGDEAGAVCFDRIDRSDILVGIYAWRYGWQPRKTAPSITEQEFRHARKNAKTCLCYVVEPGFPWRPDLIDMGQAAERLARFKKSIDKLVRSTFTTPDHLAKQVAADLAREISHASAGSFGDVLKMNWEKFSPELQDVLTAAYAQARAHRGSGEVATRHVIAAMASIPNSGQPLVTAFPKVELPDYVEGTPTPDLAELFAYDRPASGCVLGSLERLLPRYTTSQRLGSIELAVDLLKNGHGGSVAKFRAAGVDAAAVAKVENHIRKIAGSEQMLRRGLKKLSEAEIVHIAYVTNTPLPSGLAGNALSDALIAQSSRSGSTQHLAGELMRRHPRLVGLRH